MRYAYHHLGEQPEGATVMVDWSGSAADVLLLDPVNFAKYREARLPVLYSSGGRYQRPPARLTIPQDGRWYVVADLRAFGTSEAPTIQVFDPSSGDPAGQERLIEVG